MTFFLGENQYHGGQTMPEHEPLFDELLEKLNQFNTLGNKALEGELSEIGEESKQSGRLERAKKFFKGILEESKEQTTKIENLLPDFRCLSR